MEKVTCKNCKHEFEMRNERPRLIWTDPPYSVDYESTGGTDRYNPLQKKEGRSYHSTAFGGTGGHIFNDDKSPEEALDFYKASLKQLYDFTSDDVTIYWWFASRMTDANMRAMAENRWHFSQIIVWLKNSPIFSPGQLYHRIYEPCIVAWKEGKKHYQDMTFSSYTELWTLEQKTFADHLDLIYAKRDPTTKYIHPTQKPVRLAERALKRSSEKGDIVIDAFAGSGSLLIACEQLERKARLLELDPKYADAIVTRWCQYKEDTRVMKNGEIIEWRA